MEQTGKTAPEGIIPRRSPRLTSSEETPQVPASVSSTSMRGQGQTSGVPPPHRVSAGDIEIALKLSMWGINLPDIEAAAVE